MAIFTITNHKIFPTESDLNGGQGTGQGRTLTEANITKLCEGFASPGVVLSGFSLPVSGSRTQNFTGGTAVIAGYLVQGTGVTAVTIADSTTEEVWLQVLVVSGKATAVQYLTQAVNAGRPSFSVKLGTITTSGGSITSADDHRPDTLGLARGTYSGTDGAQTIDTGAVGTPSVVAVTNNGANKLLSVVFRTGISFGFKLLSDSTITFHVADGTNVPIPLSGGFSVAGAAVDTLSNSGQTFTFLSLQ